MAIKPLEQPTPEAPKTASSTEPELSWVPEPGADPQPDQAEQIDQVGDGFAIQDPDGGQAAGGQLLGRDEFHTMFQALVAAPNGYLMLKKFEPLKSLEEASSSPGCRAASDALYDTCRDVPWLRFMLAPDQVWLQRAMPVGVFVFGTYKAVRLELGERAKNSAQDPKHEKTQSPKPETPAPGADPRPEDAGPGVDQGVTVLKVGGAK